MKAKANQGVRVYGIIGAAISYSLSPKLYNTIFKRHGIDAVYNFYDCQPRQLARFARTARAVSMAGFNVTTPHKQEIIAHLDHLHATAARTGAVNLVLQRRGKLTGYNTDLEGIRHSIETELKIDPRSQRIVIFGSGGAAHSVFHYLVGKRPAGIITVHRSAAGARRFGKFVATQKFGGDYVQKVSNHKPVELPECQLCVNCTPAPIQDLVSRRSQNRARAIFELRYGDFPLLNRQHLRGNQMLSVQAAQNLKLMERLKVSYEECLRIINKAAKHD